VGARVVVGACALKEFDLNTVEPRYNAIQGAKKFSRYIETRAISSSGLFFGINTQTLFQTMEKQ
jgi:hypothetical protein